MAFRIDKQTLSDIELFSRNEKIPSIFGFYNRTATIGGQEQLYKIIRSPFSDIRFLENRKAEIRFFYNLNNTLKLNRRQLDYIEYYLKSRRVPLKTNFIDAAKNNIANKLKSNNDYYTIGEGIIHLSSLLKDLKDFLSDISDNSPPETLLKSFEHALSFVNCKTISEFIVNIPDDSRRIKSKRINQLDNYFRAKKTDELRLVLDTVYEIDVL